jgi:hypothetical protein
MATRQSTALRELAARLARVRLVSPERDLIERLDRIDVAAGNLRVAGTSAPDEAGACELVRRLDRAAGDVFANELRLVADDRAAILASAGAPAFVVEALAARPAPLAMAFSWRRGERGPPRAIARLRLGPLLGYPRCCVVFEESRRAALVVAEAEGMVETWGARAARDLVTAIDARRPFMVEEPAGEEAARLARLRRFPFVSFVPCPRCCERGAASPAGRDDARRSALALGVAPALARAIERVRGAQR